MARARRQTSTEKNKSFMTGLLILGAALLTAGVIIGVTRLWRSITSRQEFAVRPAEVVMENPGGWILADEMKRDFARTDRSGVLKGTYSIFTSGLTEAVARAYAASPWVKRVDSVRKDFPNGLDIRLTLRTPYAVIRRGADWYCVDDEGVVLDWHVYSLTSDRTATLTPRIVIPESAPLCAVGRRWDIAPVQEGLAMVQLARTQFRSAVAMNYIEVKPENARDAASPMTAVIALKDGPLINWGRTPSSKVSPVEVPTRAKTAALTLIMAKEKANLPRLKTIDLRWSQPICE